MLHRALTLAALLAFFLSACAAPPAPSPAALPDDFSLSVTVLPGAGLAPAWYIVDPDGSLRVREGVRPQAAIRPASVRTLTRDQVRALWEESTRAGLTRHDQDAPRLAPTQADAPGAAAIVSVSAMGRRSTHAIDRENATAVAPVVAHLRRLAWLDGQD